MKKKILTLLVIMLMITTVTLSVLGNTNSKNLFDNENDWKTTETNNPKNNPKNFIFNLFYLLFERYPNAFPMVKYLLIVSGLMDGFVKEGTGSLVMKLTDAPPELNITEALVTISQVNVHYAGINDTNGTWITVVNESQTFDLIQTQNATEFLGEINLPVGWYTQIRLFVDSALVTIDGIQHDLKIPSNKVKLITPFLVQDNETLILTLDFDVQKSVHETGNGKYIMKPTIKVIQEGGPVEFEADAGGDYEADVDEIIQFTGTAWGGVEPYSWFWDFRDGATSTEQNPQHAYTQEGEYEVILTVTDDTSQTATDETEAKIGDEY